MKDQMKQKSLSIFISETSSKYCLLFHSNTFIVFLIKCKNVGLNCVAYGKWADEFYHEWLFETKNVLNCVTATRG